MREADQFGMLKLAEGEKDRMIYADIDFTKECINSDFNGTNKKITVEMFSSDSDSDEYFDNSKLDDLQHNTNFINDYIFICYFPKISLNPKIKKAP